MTDHRRHNDHQVEYFSRRPVPRMVVSPGGPTPYVRRQVDAVVRAGGLVPGERVLDVGCGPGKYTVALHGAGLAVEGLDLTPKLVDDLHRAAPHIPARVGDVMDPPDDLTGFDAVTGFFVLHHLPDLTAAFRGVARVLRPGGRAVFCEPNPWFLGYYAQIALTPGMTFRGEPGLRQMRLGVVGDAARDAGFTAVSVERFGAAPPAIANRAWGRRLEQLVERIPGWGAVAAFQVFTLELP